MKRSRIGNVSTAKTLAILDAFEEWGGDNPAMPWNDVLRRLARAYRLVTPSGIPVSKSAAGTLSKCKLAFAKLRKQAAS